MNQARESNGCGFKMPLRAYRKERKVAQDSTWFATCDLALKMADTSAAVLSQRDHTFHEDKAGNKASTPVTSSPDIVI